jgi:hypothetical protein
VIGLWYRLQACRLAAEAIKGRQDGEVLAPLVWSLAVFFEAYLREGVEGTREDFGPKDAVELNVVRPRTMD